MGHYFNEMASQKAIDEYKKLWVEAEYQTLGWRCPVCGRGLAPDVKECSCVLTNVLRTIEERAKFNIGDDLAHIKFSPDPSPET